MTIFLLLPSFSFVEGDSGISVTLGIRPKTWVKRRARLFEAWKNDEEENWKNRLCSNFEDTLKRQMRLFEAWKNDKKEKEKSSLLKL